MDIRLQKINDEISYFNVVVKNMNLKDRMKLSKIKEREVTLESEVYENMPDNFDLDEKISDDTLTGWIDLIENEKLHKAVKSLPVGDQIFISYIVKERLTQRELEKIYNVDHRNIGRRFEKIIKKIKLIYEKSGNQKTFNFY